MRKYPILLTLSISASIFLSACGGGGGSTEDPEMSSDVSTNISNTIPPYQPDPTKSVGNDGSIYQFDPLPPANKPSMAVPTNPTLLPAPTRI